MKQTFVLQPLPHPARQRCRQALDAAPDGSVVTIGPAKATSAQNDKVHPLCREVQHHLEANGAAKRSEEWWRHYFVAKFAGQEIVPDPDGSGGFTVQNKIAGTSEMNKQEKSDFIEWLYAWGSEVGVEWD